MLKPDDPSGPPTARDDAPALRAQPLDGFPIEAAAARALDRRRFLCTAGSAALAALGGEWTARQLAAARAHTLEVSLAEASELAHGEARVVADPAGGEALVVRIDATTLVAFDRSCPHLGCPVLWSAEQRRFECPCHRAAFDGRSGKPLAGPPRRGLRPARLSVARA